MRVSVSVSEKSLGFGLGKFSLERKVLISFSEKFGLGKKSRFRFRKIWSREKSIGFGFGKFGFGKNVSVSVSVKVLVSSFSAYRFPGVQGVGPRVPGVQGVGPRVPGGQGGPEVSRRINNKFDLSSDDF